MTTKQPTVWIPVERPEFPDGWPAEDPHTVESQRPSYSSSVFFKLVVEPTLIVIQKKHVEIMYTWIWRNYT